MRGRKIESSPSSKKVISSSRRTSARLQSKVKVISTMNHIDEDEDSNADAQSQNSCQELKRVNKEHQLVIDSISAMGLIPDSSLIVNLSEGNKVSTQEAREELDDSISSSNVKGDSLSNSSLELERVFNEIQSKLPENQIKAQALKNSSSLVPTVPVSLQDSKAMGPPTILVHGNTSQAEENKLLLLVSTNHGRTEMGQNFPNTQVVVGPSIKDRSNSQNAATNVDILYHAGPSTHGDVVHASNSFLKSNTQEVQTFQDVMGPTTNLQLQNIPIHGLSINNPVSPSLDVNVGGPDSAHSNFSEHANADLTISDGQAFSSADSRQSREHNTPPSKLAHGNSKLWLSSPFLHHTSFYSNVSLDESLPLSLGDHINSFF